MGGEDSLEKEMATHFSVLAWRIPWTEKPSRLQSMGSQESDMTEQLSVQTDLYHLTPTVKKLISVDIEIKWENSSVPWMMEFFFFLFSFISPTPPFLPL